MTQDVPPRLEEVRTRSELGALLTQARRDSGRSLRELAAAVGSSASTLSGWCRAERLPFPAQDEVFEQLLAELGIEDSRPWLDALRRVRDVRGGTRAATDGPYPGLRSFGPDDADRFFGRERLVHAGLRVLDRIDGDPALPRLVVFVGPSGSGKSSLLQAGLRPVLVRRGYTPLDCTLGSSPTRGLAEAVATALTSPADRDRLLGAEPDRWGEVTQRCLPAGARPLLILDQLEEIFTQCRDPAERKRFLDAVTSLVSPVGSREASCTALGGLRVDFYGELVAQGHLVPSLQEAQVLVGPMEEAELAEVVVGPARQRGVGVDEALVAAALRDFRPAGDWGGGHDAGALPLLSHALAEAWAQGSGSQMRLEDYVAAGGLAGAVERSAESAVAGLGAEELDVLRHVMMRLVSMHDHVATRRAAPMDELLGLDARASASTIAMLIERFAAARLLTVHETSVTIAHEALLSAWPRLRRWLDDDREALRLQRDITAAAVAWQAHDEDPSLLATGARLDAMLEHAETGSGRLALTHDERRFLDTCLQRRVDAEAAAARSGRRLRALAAAAVIFGLVAMVAGTAALIARNEAISARNDALSRQLALVAGTVRDSDPALAAQLSIAGYRVAETSEARSALLGSARQPVNTRVLGGAGSTALAARSDGITAVSDAVASTVRLHDADGDVLATFELGDERVVYAMAFDPGGQVLAVGDTSSAVTILDVSDPTRPVSSTEPLFGPDGPIQGLAFAPDGTELAAVGLGDGVFRWAMDGPGPRSLPTVPLDEISWSVDYHPDGQQLVVGDDAGSVGVWRIDGAEPDLAFTLDAGDRSVLSVAYSSDGAMLAAGTRDGRAHLWDASVTGEPVRVDLEEDAFDSWVNAVAFTGSTTLAAGSSDATARIWALNGDHPVVDLPHPAGVTEVEFADGGARLLTTATDGALRTWDLARDRPHALADRVWALHFDGDGGLAAFSGTETRVYSVGHDRIQAERLVLPEPPDGPPFSGGGAMSPDGRLLGHGTLGGEVLLYVIDDDDAPVLVEPLLDGPPGLIEVVAFDASSTLMVAGGVGTDVWVWDVSDPAAPTRIAALEDPTEIVLDVAFDPAAELLAVASADSHVYLYDVADPGGTALVATISGFASEAYAVAFQPDDAVLVTGGTDQEVQLWDVADPSEPVRIGDPLTGPVGRIYALDVSPDGGLLAAAVTDGSVWLWDLSELERPARRAVLGPATSPMYTTSFTSDGGMLVASGADAVLRAWPLDEDEVIADLCARTGEALTEDEWGTYIPDRPFEPPCD